MAEGMSAYTATAILNAIGNNTSFAIAQSYLQLHVGAPGSAGTTNKAAELTRKSVSFGAANAGSMANDVAVTWASITGSEDATHWSLWDNATDGNGNFLWSGTITANAYVAGNTYNFAIGALTLSMTTGAALSVAFANALLDAVGNNTALAVATLYGKLYLGDPGATGTTNPATETTRKALAFATASAGSMATDGATTWTNINSSGTEDATFLGLWTDVSAGSYYGSVPITAPSYGNGDTYDIASGAATLSFTTAS
jgi:hypothetical protein